MGITTDLREAVDVLKKGHTLLFYSDIGWVIGGDASQPETVNRLVRLQPPTDQNPCTLLISEIGQLQQFVQKVPEIAWDLVKFAEKPLTVVYPNGKNVAVSALSAEGRIALRLVRKETNGIGDSHPLVNRLGRGLATIAVSPSEASATADIEALVPEVDFVFQHATEQLPAKLPTIVRLELDGQIMFIRK